MTAAMAAVVIGGGTILLFGLAMQAGKAQRKHVIGLMLAIMPLVFCVSTYNAILATSAQRSMIFDMRDQTAAWQDYVDTALQDAASAKNAQASLLPLQSSLCTLAHGERNGGLLSGSRGTGAVYSAYASACGSVGAIIDTLAVTVEQTATHRTDAVAIIAEMDRIPRDTGMTVFDRQAAFKQQEVRLRKLISETSAERVAEQVRAQLNVLQNSVATLGAQDGAFGQKQTQAVENLKSSLGLVSDAVNGLLADSGAADASMPAGVLSMDEATFKYLGRNLPSVMIAVATDAFSLWLVAFLLIARQMANSRREALNSSNIQA
jgi:hypothetical protein